MPTFLNYSHPWRPRKVLSHFYSLHQYRYRRSCLSRYLFNSKLPRLIRGWRSRLNNKFRILHPFRFPESYFRPLQECSLWKMPLLGLRTFFTRFKPHNTHLYLWRVDICWRRFKPHLRNCNECYSLRNQWPLRWRRLLSVECKLLYYLHRNLSRNLNIICPLFLLS